MNEGKIVKMDVLEKVLKGIETVERVLVKLTGFVEISDEDCPLELPASKVPLDIVFEEVSVEIED